MRASCAGPAANRIGILTQQLLTDVTSKHFPRLITRFNCNRGVRESARIPSTKNMAVRLSYNRIGV